MISQRCPKCKSRRIRRGYQRTPFWMQMLFRYHLLCDNCNWEFTGFAVPGTVSAKPKRARKSAGQTDRPLSPVPRSFDTGPADGSDGSNSKKVKKKIKVKY